MQYLWYYLFLINAAAFLLMRIDKEKAKRNKWRISEATLFGSAVLGGSVGILLGMVLFHHKTKHKKFIWGIPVILAAQMAVWKMTFF